MMTNYYWLLFVIKKACPDRREESSKSLQHHACGGHKINSLEEILKCQYCLLKQNFADITK
jgi:hypothetical protein